MYAVMTSKIGQYGIYESLQEAEHEAKVLRESFEIEAWVVEAR